MIDCLVSIMNFFKAGTGCCGGLLYLVYTAAIFVGSCQLLIFLYSFGEFLHRHLFRKKHDLLLRYAGGKAGSTWAVVTGAGDGIGAAYCELLAREGFNIALVSRTLSKMQAVEKKCKEVNPAIKTLVVEADFSMAKRPRQEDITAFYDSLYNRLKDLDIAILINNAGVMYTGRFDEFGPEATRWKEMLDINILHVAMMTTYFKDKLIARQASTEGRVKTALINVSSAMGYLKGSKGAAIYSSTKGFVTYFTAALGWELRNQLDV